MLVSNKIHTKFQKFIEKVMLKLTWWCLFLSIYIGARSDRSIYKSAYFVKSIVNINYIIGNFIRPYQNWIIEYPEFSFAYIFTLSFYVEKWNTSYELRVTSSNPRVTSSNPRVRRVKARVAKLKARVGRLWTQVWRLKARVEATKPRVK